MWCGERHVASKAGMNSLRCAPRLTERPPREVESLLGKDGAESNDEENVEDGRSDDCTKANVVVGDKDAHQGGEELGGRPTSSHPPEGCVDFLLVSELILNCIYATNRRRNKRRRTWLPRRPP